MTLKATTGLVDGVRTHQRIGSSAVFEKWAEDLSTSFINYAAARIDEGIDAALARVIEILDVDHCTMFAISPATGELEETHAAARRLPRINDPPATVDAALGQFGLQSDVAMPMIVANELRGVITFGYFRKGRAWSAVTLSRMRRLTDIFANALERKRAQEELEFAVGFERLAASILASLLLAKLEDEAEAVDRGLCDIARFINVERVTLWERLPGTTSFRKARHWLAPGIAAGRCKSAQSRRPGSAPDSRPTISCRSRG